MTSNKSIIQNFSAFRGEDSRSSDLTRPVNAAKEAKNFIIEQDFALGGDKGFHLFSKFFVEEPILGSFVYIYKDPQTDQEVAEFLLLGKSLYKLTSGVFTITSTTITTWGYEFVLDPTDSEFHLRIFNGASTALDYAVGTGLEDDSTGFVTLGDLEAQIDPLAFFSATANSTIDAIAAAAFPLVAEYDLPAGSVDIPIYYWEEVPGRRSSNDATQGLFSPYVNAHRDINQRPPTFINKNNCCYIACDGYTPLMKYDGATVSQACVFGGPADSDVQLSANSNSPALVGSFKYYLRPLTRDAKGNYIYGAGYETDVITTTSGQAPRIGYLGAPTGGIDGFLRAELGEDSTTNAATNTVTLDSPLDESALELYGFRPLGVGDYIHIQGNATPSTATRRVTAVNRVTNEIAFDGPPITFSNAGATVVSWANLSRMVAPFVTTTSLQSGVSTIAGGVSGVGVGTWLYFPNEDAWFQVTAVTTSTITIDGVVDIPSGSYYISAGVIEVFRTEDQGLERFYFSRNIPAHPQALNSYYFDTTADVDLGAELIRPVREPYYLREFPGVIVQHQGVMITAGGKHRSGRIHFEDFEYIEGFPILENFYDIPSQDAGVLTALWSDSYDQLAVFKETAYISVVGSFRDDIAILNSTINSENGLGVSSQSSLLKLREGVNLGVGPLGFIAFSGGRIDYEFTKQLSADFLSANVGNNLSPSEQLRVNRALAINDKFKEQAYFFIPAFNVEDGLHSGANGNSKIFTIDYSEQTWTKRVFPSDLSVGNSGLVPFPFYPTAGMVGYDKRLFFISCAYDSTLGNGDHLDFNSYIFRRKEREVLYTGVTDFRQDYSDGHAPISYSYKPGWLMTTPLEDGLFHWLKLYSLPKADFVPFSLRIRTYIDFDEDTLIDDVTVAFTSSTKKRLIKLSATRCESLLLHFTTEAILEKPTITGFAVVPGTVDGELEGVR